MKISKFSILLSALSVTVIAACTSCSKVLPYADILNNEIRFVVTDTKAFSETTASTLQSNGFKAAAVIDADNSVMFNSAMAYSDGAFSVPDKHYYFPTGGTMSFYAVYPADEVIALSDGAASLTYSHNSDDDLIAAKAETVGKQSSAVEMKFDHILSQLNITAKGEETTVDYKLMKVIVTAANGGVYTFADGKWTPNGTTANLSIYDNASGMAVSTSTKTAVGSAVSVMPGDVKLRAVWKCYNKGTSIIVNEKDVTIDVTLEKGKNTTLDLSLPFNGTGLTFSSTIGAWNPDPQSAVVKYKPELLPGVFTVCDSPLKKVKFAKGNLVWNGEEFSCEANQYDYPTSWDASHVGHFYWDKSASEAINEDYSWPEGSEDDIFFAADGGVFTGFTVLSYTEWDYLFSKAVAKNSSSKNTIVIDGKNCLVLKPDGFSGTVADSYSAAEWVEAEKSGLVALPFAGYRYGSGFYYVGSNGYYWSSTPYDSNDAWGAYFGSDYAYTNYGDRRYYGFSVRLVSVQ